MKQSNFNEQNFNFNNTLDFHAKNSKKCNGFFWFDFWRINQNIFPQKIVLLNFYTKNPDFEQNFDVKTIGKSTIRKKNPNSIFCHFVNFP